MKKSLEVISYFVVFVSCFFAGAAFADQQRYDVGQITYTSKGIILTPDGEGVAVLITQTEVKELIPMNKFPDELVVDPNRVITLLNEGKVTIKIYSEYFFRGFLLEGASAEYHKKEKIFILSPTQNDLYGVKIVVEDKKEESSEFMIWVILAIAACITVITFFGVYKASWRQTSIYIACVIITVIISMGLSFCFINEAIAVFIAFIFSCIIAILLCTLGVVKTVFMGKNDIISSSFREVAIFICGIFFPFVAMIACCVAIDVNQGQISFFILPDFITFLLFWLLIPKLLSTVFLSKGKG